MEVVIIEDEALAASRLSMLIKNYNEKINITATLESVEEAVAWLNTKKHPDLFFVDIHLADGHSFEIFKQAKINKPVIFTTAYDQYALDAFQFFSIDYMLKPILADDLATAFAKYERLKGLQKISEEPDFSQLINALKDNVQTKYKNRFLGKIGQKMYFVPIENISHFSAENKIVQLVTRDGSKYIINQSIEKLEELCDPKLFFRINRKTMLHIDSIQMVKPYDNNRLQVGLAHVTQNDELIVSREKVGLFKSWAEA
jgi:two-component system, LytTR family, response regulator LytT